MAGHRLHQLKCKSNLRIVSIARYDLFRRKKRDLLLFGDFDFLLSDGCSETNGKRTSASKETERLKWDELGTYQKACS